MNEEKQPLIYRAWEITKRKALKRGYRNEYENRTTDKSYQDWTADLYAVYVESFYGQPA